MKVYHLPVPTVPYESYTKHRRIVLKSGDNGVTTGVFRASRDLPRQCWSSDAPQHKRRGSKFNKRVYRCDLPSLAPCATLVGALRADVARWATTAPHLRSDS